MFLKSSVVNFGIDLPCLPCMDLCGFVWPYVASYGLMKPCMALYGLVGSFCRFSLSWPWLASFEIVRPCVIYFDLVWSLWPFYGLIWHFMVGYGRISYFLAIIEPNSFGLVSNGCTENFESACFAFNEQLFYHDSDSK